MDRVSLLMSFTGFPLTKARSILTQVQQMSVEKFVEWQQKQAWDIARFHYDNNTLYKTKVGPIFPDRWEDLPMITKKDLQKPVQEVLTKGISYSDCYVGSTSGSSGVPFFFAKDKFTHAMTWAVITNRYKAWNLDSNSKQARFYGIPKEWKGYWKERIKDKAMNRVRFSVFDLSDSAFNNFVKIFKHNTFTYIYGYTNALVLFARFLVQNNLVLKNICPTLNLCISTSEVSTPEDHELLEKGFGVKHIREYGVSETCLTAFDMPSDKWTLTEETLYTEIVGENGESVSYGTAGNLLTTSLFNRAYPMIRYQVGDMAILEDRSNSIYRSLHSLIGRTNDTVQLPGGKRAAGLTFYYISRSILESTGVLKEFIIRQTSLSHFVFDIVADRDLTPAETQQIKDKMALYLEPGLELTINRVQFIDRPASGKLKHFYSEISN
jgi:phenylacetate-CoA ligase